MANVGDVIQLRDFQTYLGVEFENVYYYQVDVLGSGSVGAALATAFNSVVRPPLLQFQSEACDHVGLGYTNLMNLNEFGTVTTVPTPSGVVTGQGQASFYALTFKLFRTDRSVRNGYKRIGGIPETVVTGNSVDAAFTADVDAFAETLDNDLSSNGYTFVPVIYGAPTGPPNNLPERIVPVIDAVFLKVSTQRSRLAT
jgi:hypothetical protein